MLTVLSVPGPADVPSVLIGGLMMILIIAVSIPCALDKGSRAAQERRRRLRAAQPSTSCPTSQGYSR